ncbi:MAG TPA: hypothetical protein DGT21_02715 [Armatimonadetes bacterium]|nr:hypothetical protein [Armatimonadota bacterium]
MTLVMAWLNKKDSPTSLNIAADSLLSDGKQTWQHATKIWRVHPTHDYVAYAGDSHYALTMIHEYVALLDWTTVLRGSAQRQTNTGRTLSAPTGPRARARALMLNMRQVMLTFPESWGSSATLIYAGFDTRVERFHLFRLDLRKEEFEDVSCALAEKPVCYGSGAKAAAKLLRSTCPLSTPAVIGVLNQAIAAGKNKVGGHPQMVIVKKRGSTAQAFNRDENSRKLTVLFGVPVQFKSDLPRVQCRDASFKLVRPSSSGRIIRVQQREDQTACSAEGP